MQITGENQESMRLLSGLEEGTFTANDAYTVASKRDPVLVYFIIRYLREKYPPNHPASAGVVARLVEFTSTYPAIVKLSQNGEKDPIREWFDDTYNMREFFAKPDELITMIIDKIES
jgi:hypothetical protein